MATSRVSSPISYANTFSFWSLTTAVALFVAFLNNNVDDVQGFVLLPSSIPTVNSRRKRRGRQQQTPAIYRQEIKTCSSSSSTLLNLKFIDSSSSSEEEEVSVIELKDDEDQSLRDASKVMEELYGVSWFDNDEAWEQLKMEYPLLESYKNDQLRLVYLKQKPNFIDIFTKTPIGPFLIINLLFLLTGCSWCDTPFGQIKSCPPPSGL